MATTMLTHMNYGVHNGVNYGGVVNGGVVNGGVVNGGVVNGGVGNQLNPYVTSLLNFISNNNIINNDTMLGGQPAKDETDVKLNCIKIEGDNTKSVEYGLEFKTITVVDEQNFEHEIQIISKVTDQYKDKIFVGDIIVLVNNGHPYSETSPKTVDKFVKNANDAIEELYYQVYNDTSVKKQKIHIRVKHLYINPTKDINNIDNAETEWQTKLFPNSRIETGNDVSGKVNDIELNLDEQNRKDVETKLDAITGKMETLSQNMETLNSKTGQLAITSANEAIKFTNEIEDLIKEVRNDVKNVKNNKPNITHLDEELKQLKQFKTEAESVKTREEAAVAKADRLKQIDEQTITGNILLKKTPKLEAPTQAPTQAPTKGVTGDTSSSEVKTESVKAPSISGSVTIISDLPEKTEETAAPTSSNTPLSVKSEENQDNVDKNAAAAPTDNIVSSLLKLTGLGSQTQSRDKGIELTSSNSQSATNNVTGSDVKNNSPPTKKSIMVGTIQSVAEAVDNNAAASATAVATAVAPTTANNVSGSISISPTVLADSHAVDANNSNNSISGTMTIIPEVQQEPVLVEGNEVPPPPQVAELTVNNSISGTMTIIPSVPLVQSPSPLVRPGLSTAVTGISTDSEFDLDSEFGSDSDSTGTRQQPQQQTNSISGTMTITPASMLTNIISPMVTPFGTGASGTGTGASGTGTGTGTGTGANANGAKTPAVVQQLQSNSISGTMTITPSSAASGTGQGTGQGSTTNSTNTVSGTVSIMPENQANQSMNQGVNVLQQQPNSISGTVTIIPDGAGQLAPQIVQSAAAVTQQSSAQPGQEISNAQWFLNGAKTTGKYVAAAPVALASGAVATGTTIGLGAAGVGLVAAAVPVAGLGYGAYKGSQYAYNNLPAPSMKWPWSSTSAQGDVTAQVTPVAPGAVQTQNSISGTMTITPVSAVVPINAQAQVAVSQGAVVPGTVSTGTASTAVQTDYNPEIVKGEPIITKEQPQLQINNNVNQLENGEQSVEPTELNTAQLSASTEQAPPQNMNKGPLDVVGNYVYVAEEIYGKEETLPNYTYNADPTVAPTAAPGATVGAITTGGEQGDNNQPDDTKPKKLSSYAHLVIGYRFKIQSLVLIDRNSTKKWWLDLGENGRGSEIEYRYNSRGVPVKIGEITASPQVIAHMMAIYNNNEPKMPSPISDAEYNKKFAEFKQTQDKQLGVANANREKQRKLRAERDVKESELREQIELANNAKKLANDAKKVAKQGQITQEIPLYEGEDESQSAAPTTSSAAAPITSGPAPVDANTLAPDAANTQQNNQNNNTISGNIEIIPQTAENPTANPTPTAANVSGTLSITPTVNPTANPVNASNVSGTMTITPTLQPAAASP